MVGIILVNYKTYAEKYLLECRDSLRLQTKKPDFIYVIDNCSSQESLSFLKNNFTEAVILPRDDGNYCAANNLGIKKAKEDNCEFIVIANMDVAFDKYWLEELVLALKNNPGAGMVQSKILDYNTGKINTIGNKMHFLGFGYAGGDGNEDKEIQGYPEIQGYASGCAFITRAKDLQYNEEYYMYHDDMEVGLKAIISGKKILLAPKSIVYHK